MRNVSNVSLALLPMLSVACNGCKMLYFCGSCCSFNRSSQEAVNTLVSCSFCSQCWDFCSFSLSLFCGCISMLSHRCLGGDGLCVYSFFLCFEAYVVLYRNAVSLQVLLRFFQFRTSRVVLVIASQEKPPGSWSTYELTCVFQNVLLILFAKSYSVRWIDRGWRTECNRYVQSCSHSHTRDKFEGPLEFMFLHDLFPILFVAKNCGERQVRLARCTERNDRTLNVAILNLSF